MFTLVITTALLAVMYGLAWHNQPANEHENARRPDPTENP